MVGLSRFNKFLGNEARSGDSAHDSTLTRISQSIYVSFVGVKIRLKVQLQQPAS